MLWFKNSKVEKLEKELVEIKQELRKQQKNTKELTEAVTQIYNLIAKIVSINSKF